MSSPHKEHRDSNPQSEGTQNPELLPRRERCQITWGTQLARPAPERRTPQNVKLGKATGPDQEPHNLQLIEKEVLRGSRQPGPGPPADRPGICGKGARLLTLGLRLGGQGPAGIPPRMGAGGCIAVSSFFPAGPAFAPLGPAPAPPAQVRPHALPRRCSNLGTGLRSKRQRARGLEDGTPFLTILTRKT